MPVEEGCDILQNLAKQFKYIGKKAKAEIADVLGTEVDVLEVYYMNRMSEGLRIPLLVLEGGKLRQAELQDATASTQA